MGHADVYKQPVEIKTWTMGKIIEKKSIYDG